MTARNTDPWTSHAAAASVRTTPNQKALMQMFLVHGRPITDHDMVKLYEDLRSRGYAWPRQSESGLRSRRKELVRKGFIVDTGETETLPSGRKAILWKGVRNV